MGRLDDEKKRKFTEDFLIVASMVYHWKKQKPDNDELKVLSMCVADIGDYIKGLEVDNKMLKKLYDGEKK